MRWMTACLGLLACWPLQAPEQMRDPWGVRKAEEKPAVTIHRWQGKDGNADSGANWSTGTPISSWSNGDGAVIDGVLSQRSLTSGLSQPSLGLAQWDVHENFRGNIGGPGNPLYVGECGDAGSGYKGFRYHGRGTAYLKVNDVYYHSRVFVNSPNLLDAVHLLANASRGYDEVWVYSGAVTLEQTADFIGGANQLESTLGLFGQDARVTVYGEAGDTLNPANIIVDAGRLFLGRRDWNSNALSPPVLHISGGYVQAQSLSYLSRLTMTGGYLEPQQHETMNGTLLWMLAAGTLDLRSCRNAIDASGLFVGPNFELIGGSIVDEATFLTNLMDLRKEFP